MPIYEYECTECGQVTEIFQRMSDDPLKKCQCGGSVNKLMSLNSFHLKGTGWYVTDYGKGSKGQGTDPAGGEKKADKTDKDAKADSTKKTDKSTKADKPKADKPKAESKNKKAD